MSEADESVCRKYVARRLSSAAEVNRLRADLLAVESALEQAERHARSVRDVRDSLLARLVNASD